MNHEPHWLVTAFVSAAMGVALPYLFLFIGAMRGRFKKRNIEGRWFEYHTTYHQDNGAVVSTEWLIQRAVLVSFRVTCIRKGVKAMRYRGPLIEHRGHFILTLTADDNISSAAFRLTIPHAGPDATMLGFWVSRAFDRDMKIASGAVVVSRKRMSEEEVRLLLNKAVTVESELPLMRLTMPT